MNKTQKNQAEKKVMSDLAFKNAIDEKERQYVHSFIFFLISFLQTLQSAQLFDSTFCLDIKKNNFRVRS